MIATLLAEMASDARNTIGCLVMVPILIASMHYYRSYRLRREKADCASIAEKMEAVFSDKRVLEEETKAVATLFAGLDAGPVPLNDGNNDNNNNNAIGFEYYDERDEDEDDLLGQEVVEITFDLGSMEVNVLRFLTRMHRAVI